MGLHRGTWQIKGFLVADIKEQSSYGVLIWRQSSLLVFFDWGNNKKLKQASFSDFLQLL